MPKVDVDLDNAKAVTAQFERIFGDVTATERDWLIFHIAKAIKESQYVSRLKDSRNILRDGGYLFAKELDKVLLQTVEGLE